MARNEYIKVRRDFKQRLEALRLESGLSVTDWADHLGLSRCNYYRLVTRAKCPSVGSIQSILAATNRPLEYFLEVGEAPRAPDPDEVALNRLRDLLKDEFFDGKEQLRQAIEMTWKVHFHERDVMLKNRDLANEESRQ